MKTNNKKSVYSVIRMGVACLIFLLAGVGVMVTFAKMKKPPEEKVVTEQPVSVETFRVELQDVPVSISGYGEVKALNKVELAPEISGKIAEVNINLEVGEVIPAGELLFRIDSADYKNEYDTAVKRLATLKRNAELALKEFERLKKLHRTNTATLKDQETGEQAYNAAKDSMDQMERIVFDAKRNLDKCTVLSPFNARVTSVSVEAGEYVSPGTPVLTIADDSVLEVQVSLDSSKAKKSLDFNDTPPSWNGDISWFNRLKAVDCAVSWTGGGNDVKTIGKLHRIVKYDPDTRTVCVAVRINAQGTGGSAGMFPIVDGMFCKVEIPGATYSNVAKIPRESVSAGGRVYLATGDRLKTVTVSVAGFEDTYAIVETGLNNGDQVIITSLSNPLENTLLKVSEIRLYAEKSEADAEEI